MGLAVRKLIKKIPKTCREERKGVKEHIYLYDTSKVKEVKQVEFVDRTELIAQLNAAKYESEESMVGV